MIDENIKVHDKFSVEIKVGFVTKKKQKINDFALNIWMFVPNSLDINRFTYSKDDFYRDLTSYVRLITPFYLLRDIADETKPPFSSLEKAFSTMASTPTRSNKENYEYQIKMFLSILKSSLREEVAHAVNSKIEGDRNFLIDSYLTNIKVIAQRYRSFQRIINTPSISSELFDYFHFGDEFMSNLIEFHTFRLLDQLKTNHPILFKKKKVDLLELIDSEIGYKKEKGFLYVEKNSISNNQLMVFNQGMLKKYAESNLFLEVKKRKDGIFVEQFVFSLTAGFSMIIATAIAFSFQREYGNFTMPFFVALVVSYMLKDRIKELSRFYLANKMGKRYFDHKINISTHDNQIGWIKESMDFVSESNVPVEVEKIRNRSSILEANHRANRERVILYRTLMQLNRESIDANSEYPIAGVNKIMRLNISSLIQKMDNSEFPLYYPDPEEGFVIVPGEKIYFLNMIVQIKNLEHSEYKRYRIVFNREGIHKIEKFEN